MRVELMETSAEIGLHAHPELWVKVVTPGPVGPEIWPEVFKSLEPATRIDIAERFTKTPCDFYVDTWDDDDPERNEGFIQWWIFPALPGKGGK